MSQDEIVFDDVRYREPERRRRPDRDRRWACLAYEVPGPIDLPIFLDRATADAIERHALRDTSVELGGILLGKECIDDQTGLPFVVVVKSLEAKHYENTQASFTYTHDSWEEITRERDRLHPELDIVGWYHTHPDFGIFLSSHDLFIHRHFFAQTLQVAYVVDPIRQTRGFFQWRDGGLEQVGGYFLFADRGERAALSRLVNDLENIPNTEGGGSLSPRLEAELIAMLTRPAPSHMTSADRTQSAALFGLLGALAGMIALAGVLWLTMLNKQVQEQTRILSELEHTTRDSAAKQSLALDTLIESGTGEKAEKFSSQYDQVSRERDEARREIGRLQTTRIALTDRAQAFEKQNVALQKDLAVAKKTADLYDAETKEYPDLRTRLNSLSAESESKTRKIEELRNLLDNAEGRKAEALMEKYNRAWYAAVIGWGIGLFMTLGLLAFLSQSKPETQAEPGPEAGPAAEPPPPTHRIV